MEVDGAVSKTELPESMRIVADGYPTYLARFSVEAIERREYERLRRQALEKAYYRSSWGETEQVIFSGSILLLPLALAIDNAKVRRSADRELRNAGVIEPISDEDGQRLAALFDERATSTALTKQVLNLAGSASRGADYPRLTIRVDTIQVEQLSLGRTFRVIAQAQVYSAPDVQQARTTHTSIILYRGDDPTRRAIDGVFAVLSQSIVATYFPQHPFSVEYNHWQRVSNSFDPAEVRSYLDRYPEGRFVKPAHEQLYRIKSFTRQQKSGSETK